MHCCSSEVFISTKQTLSCPQKIESWISSEARLKSQIVSESKAKSDRRFPSCPHEFPNSACFWSWGGEKLLRNRHRGFSWKQTSTNKNKSLMAKLSYRFRPRFHHIWRRICDIDWLKLLQILLARHRTFRLFMLERALNGPIFQHRLNSAFSRGAVDYFQLPPSIGCLELQFNLDRQSLKAETFSIKEFYSGFSTRIKLFISSTTAGSFNK